MITYVIKDPVSLNVRYVGKTKDSERRFKEHMSQTRSKKYSNSNVYLYDWICRIVGFGYRPIFEIIECFDNEAYWIKYYREKGHIFNGWASDCDNKNFKEYYPILDDIKKYIRLIRRKSKSFKTKIKL